MSRAILRYVGVALIVGGVILSTTGIGAFSTVTADRQMFVGVGEKSTSYLGISTTETTVTTNGTNDTRGMDTVATRRGSQSGSEVVLGSVTNYFPAKLDSVTVTVSESGRTSLAVREVQVENVPLEPGTAGDLVATIDCGSASQRTELVTMEFEAAGTDTSATATRTVPVTCVNGTSPSRPASSSPQRPLPTPWRTSSGST